MKFIELTQGRKAVVDDEDFAWLSQWNWYYHKNRKHGYAERKEAGRIVLMHREISRHHGLLKPGMEVDHWNDCGLDNRKENLRVATQNDNAHNRGKHQNNSSGVPGVSWHKQHGKWHAKIMLNGKDKHLGYFNDLEDAKAARQAAERKYFGKFQYDPTLVCPLAQTGECPECAAKLKQLVDVSH